MVVLCWCAVRFYHYGD